MISPVEGATSAIPADDRGFLYGDGLFETVVARDGVLLWDKLHRSRLVQGMARLDLSLDLTPLWDALKQQATAAGADARVLRLTVTRGSGPRGYAPGEDVVCRWRVSSSALARDPLDPLPPAAVFTSALLVAEQPLLAGIKHCNRLEQVLAAREAKRRGVDDVLMLTARGEMQCSSKANLFALRGDTLLTPSCERCGIAGTRRQLVLEQLAPLLGLQCRIEALTPQQILNADGVFLCNSIIGIQAVCSLDSKPLPLADTIASLQHLYRERSLACAAG